MSIYPFSEIPVSVVEFDTRYIVQVKRNIAMAPYPNDAPLADNRLVEMSAIFKFDSNDVIARSGLLLAL